jgi:preprotein translocase subunit SecE
VTKDATGQEKPSILDRFQDYIRNTRAELRKVTWPTRNQTVNLSLIVLAVTAAMAVFLGAVDYLFSQVVRVIIS